MIEISEDIFKYDERYDDYYQSVDEDMNNYMTHSEHSNIGAGVVEKLEQFLQAYEKNNAHESIRALNDLNRAISQMQRKFAEADAQIFKEEYAAFMKELDIPEDSKHDLIGCINFGITSKDIELLNSIFK